MLHVRPSRDFRVYQTLCALHQHLLILQTPHEVLTSLYLAPGPKSTATIVPLGHSSSLWIVRYIWVVWVSVVVVGVALLAL